MSEKATNVCPDCGAKKISEFGCGKLVFLGVDAHRKYKGIGFECGTEMQLTGPEWKNQSDQCKLNVSEQKRAKLLKVIAPFAAYAEGIMSVFEQMPDDHQACKIYSEKPASITIGDCKALVAARAADQVTP